MSQAFPFVSVVVAAHGRSASVLRCLTALARLEYPAHRMEVIVVDDGSDPPLKRNACGAPAGTRWFNLDSLLAPVELIMVRQPRRGLAAARNAGARRASGKVLVFLDVDCAPSKRWLVRLVSRMIEERGAVIGGRSVNHLADNPYCAANELIERIVRDPWPADEGERSLVRTPCLGILAADFHEAGGFGSGPGAERDLFARLRRTHHRLVFAPEVVVRRRRALTLDDFWRQHAAFGRSLASGRREPASLATRREAAARWLEAARFWLSRVFRDRELRAALRTATLLATWQAAIAAGFVGERLRSLRSPAGASGATTTR